MSPPFWSRLPLTTPGSAPRMCGSSSSEQSDGRAGGHHSGWAAAAHCEAEGVQLPAGEVRGASGTGCSSASCAPSWTSSLMPSRLHLQGKANEVFDKFNYKALGQEEWALQQVWVGCSETIFFCPTNLPAVGEDHRMVKQNQALVEPMQTMMFVTRERIVNSRCLVTWIYKWQKP